MRTQLIMACLAFMGMAQTQDTTQVATVTRATFLSPGFSYERPIGSKQTLYAQAYLSPSAYFSYSSSLGTSSGFSFTPAITAQFRHYYNLEKRVAEGKRTDMNSANYLAGAFDFSSHKVVDNVGGTTKREPLYQIGVLWGLQRNFAKRFSLDLNIGPGIVFTKQLEMNDDYTTYRLRNTTSYTTLGQFNLGFWLNKQK